MGYTTYQRRRVRAERDARVRAGYEARYAAEKAKAGGGTPKKAMTYGQAWLLVFVLFAGVGLMWKFWVVTLIVLGAIVGLIALAFGISALVNYLKQYDWSS